VWWLATRQRCPGQRGLDVVFTPLFPSCVKTTHVRPVNPLSLRARATDVALQQQHRWTLCLSSYEFPCTFGFLVRPPLHIDQVHIGNPSLSISRCIDGTLTPARVVCTLAWHSHSSYASLGWAITLVYRIVTKVSLRKKRNLRKKVTKSQFNVVFL
jgi:hypothetical protein